MLMTDVKKPLVWRLSALLRASKPVSLLSSDGGSMRLLPGIAQGDAIGGILPRMNPVFETHFGPVRVRFALNDRELFVSKDDLYRAIGECFTASIRSLGAAFLDGGLSLLGDAQDRKSVVLGNSMIGPAIHFHAAANLLHALGSLTDVDRPELRESSFRIHALARWYVMVLPAVDDYFGRDIMDVMNAVKVRLDRLNPPLVVEVSVGDGMWTAECDALGLVTEADSYEALTVRAWEIAADLACDVPGLDPEHLRLSFQQTQSENPLRLAH